MMKEPHLKVFDKRSELVHSDGSIESFLEGPATVAARERYRKVIETLENGYLEQLEELNEKIVEHPELRLVGFVTSVIPERLEELENRKQDIQTATGVQIEIWTLSEWVHKQFDGAIAQIATSEQAIATAWLVAYGETLALQRLEQAPIEEPCYHWLQTLHALLK